MSIPADGLDSCSRMQRPPISQVTNGWASQHWSSRSGFSRQVAGYYGAGRYERHLGTVVLNARPMTVSKGYTAPMAGSRMGVRGGVSMMPAFIRERSGIQQAGPSEKEVNLLL